MHVITNSLYIIVIDPVSRNESRLTKHIYEWIVIES